MTVGTRTRAGRKVGQYTLTRPFWTLTARLMLNRNPHVKPKDQPTTFSQTGWIREAARRAASNANPLASNAASCHASGTKAIQK